jgi:hypothetical protein
MNMKEVNDKFMEREAEILKRFDEVRPNKTFLMEAIEVLDMEFGGDVISDMIIEGIIKNEQ